MLTTTKTAKWCITDPLCWEPPVTVGSPHKCGKGFSAILSSCILHPVDMSTPALLCLHQQNDTPVCSVLSNTIVTWKTPELCCYGDASISFLGTSYGLWHNQTAFKECDAVVYETNISKAIGVQKWIPLWGLLHNSCVWQAPGQQRRWSNCKPIVLL